MNEQQVSELINLIKKNNELLSEGINLLRKQITLFEQYDAEILFKDEELREQVLHQRPGRT